MVTVVALFLAVVTVGGVVSYVAHWMEPKS